MSTRSLATEFRGLLGAFGRGIVGAIEDCEQFVASDRARHLRLVVDLVATAGVWAAWTWLAILALYIAVTPLGVDLAPLASDGLGFRDALFVVLAVALIGPIAVILGAWALLFVYRVTLDFASRRLPRAFAALASPALVLTALAGLWAFRTRLHATFWHLYDELANVLFIAGQFTPVV